MRSRLVIWGTSGHTMVVADIVRLLDEYTIVGYLDDVNLDRHGTEFLGAPVLGGREQLSILRAQGVRELIIGFASTPARSRASALARELGFELPTVAHPRATLAERASVGSGVIIKANAVIEPGAVVGPDAIVGAGAIIAHEAVIGATARVCAGSVVGGRAEIGQGTWLGIGTYVRDRVEIGDWSLIGTGAVVVGDIPDRVVAYGVPARVARAALADDL